jgi:uncharacterized protein YndB with AHSA1/START domain
MPDPSADQRPDPDQAPGGPAVEPESSTVVTRQVPLDVSVERAWELISDPGELEGWLAPEVSLDLTPGGAARFVEEDGTVRDAVVEAIEPGRRLQFRWWPAPDPAAPSDDLHDLHDLSRVELVLEPDPRGVRLVVTERRLAPGAVPAACLRGSASAAPMSFSHRREPATTLSRRSLHAAASDRWGWRFDLACLCLWRAELALVR